MESIELPYRLNNKLCGKKQRKSILQFAALVIHIGSHFPHSEPIFSFSYIAECYWAK